MQYAAQVIDHNWARWSAGKWFKGDSFKIKQFLFTLLLHLILQVLLHFLLAFHLGQLAVLLLKNALLHHGSYVLLVSLHLSHVVSTLLTQLSLNGLALLLSRLLVHCFRYVVPRLQQKLIGSCRPQ